MRTGVSGGRVLLRGLVRLLRSVGAGLRPPGPGVLDERGLLAASALQWAQQRRSVPTGARRRRLVAASLALVLGLGLVSFGAVAGVGGFE